MVAKVDLIIPCLNYGHDLADCLSPFALAERIAFLSQSDPFGCPKSSDKLLLSLVLKPCFGTDRCAISPILPI